MERIRVVSEAELLRELQAVLRGVHPSVAIAVLGKLGKKFRRENSIRTNNFHPLELDRPDLDTMK